MTRSIAGPSNEDSYSYFPTLLLSFAFVGHLVSDGMRYGCVHETCLPLNENTSTYKQVHVINAHSCTNQTWNSLCTLDTPRHINDHTNPHAHAHARTLGNTLLLVVQVATPALLYHLYWESDRIPYDTFPDIALHFSFPFFAVSSALCVVHNCYHNSYYIYNR